MGLQYLKKVGADKLGTKCSFNSEHLDIAIADGWIFTSLVTFYT